MIEGIKVVVSGVSAMPLAGIIDGIDQTEYYRQQRNYLTGGAQVTAVDKKCVTHKPLDSNKEKQVWAYKIDGVSGWFSVNNFNFGN